MNARPGTPTVFTTAWPSGSCSSGRSFESASTAKIYARKTFHFSGGNRKKSGWATANVTGCGPIKYWIGFTEHPRKQNEGELSGILIYTRGKISQEETFFDISGGVTGQHGLRYMVGMVKAEWLDAGADSPDHIATPRDSIAWESPEGTAFKEWGANTLEKVSLRMG